MPLAPLDYFFQYKNSHTCNCNLIFLIDSIQFPQKIQGTLNENNGREIEWKIKFVVNTDCY